MARRAFPHVVCATFTGAPESVAEVRALVMRALAGTGFPVGDVVLAACELATNAVLYSRSRDGEYDVWIGCNDVIVQVLVIDEGPLPDGETPAALDRCGGNGLRIVQALASDTGHYNDPNGCHVAWFRLSNPQGA